MADFGLFIVACGRPNYGAMAFNLAASFRAANPHVPIAVAYTDAHKHSSGADQPHSLSWLNEGQLALFDVKIDVGADVYNHNGVTQYQRAKTFAYQLSPFGATLCLDADTAWSWAANVNDVVTPYAGAPFTAMNYLHKPCGDQAYQYPKHSYTFWADDARIANVWGVQGRRIYQIQSSFYYFTKGKQAEKYFKATREAYDNPRVTTADGLPEWANAIPDEYAYNVATAVTGTELHESPYMPLFVPSVQAHTREVRMDRIAKGWCGISMAGHRINSMPMHSIYDSYVAAGCQKLGFVSHWPYRMLEKAVHQKERAKH